MAFNRQVSSHECLLLVSVGSPFEAHVLLSFHLCVERGSCCAFYCVEFDDMPCILVSCAPPAHTTVSCESTSVTIVGVGEPKLSTNV
jgi:hypothetical protein